MEIIIKTDGDNELRGVCALGNGTTYGIATKYEYAAKEFMNQNFNTPNKIDKSGAFITYEYLNGDTVEWIKPSAISSMGRKVDVLYIEKTIDQEIIDSILIPIVHGGEIKYIDRY